MSPNTYLEERQVQEKVGPRKRRKHPKLEPFPLLRMAGKVKLKRWVTLISPGTKSALAVRGVTGKGQSDLRGTPTTQVSCCKRDH